MQVIKREVFEDAGFKGEEVELDNGVQVIFHPSGELDFLDAATGDCIDCDDARYVETLVWATRW